VALSAHQHKQGDSAVTRQERFVPADPERVLDLLTDVAAWPSWQPDVSSVEVDGPLAFGSVFRWRSGVAITSTVTVLEPARLVWTGRAIGTRAVHGWTLESVAGGTLVRTEESMSGWLPRLMRRSMQRTLEKGVASTLDALVVRAADVDAPRA
jgi:hypothetical protein